MIKKQKKQSLTFIGLRHSLISESSLGQGHTALTLIFAAAVLVGGLADLIAFEKQDLRTSFTGINLRW